VSGDKTRDRPIAVVTGGAGFVGSHLCELLVEKGYDVISLDNYSYGSDRNHVRGVSYRRGHTRDIDTLVPEIPELLFHLGEYARVARSLDEPELVFDSNVIGTLGVISFWHNRRCKLVYAGSSTEFSEQGSMLSPYTWTKSANSDLISNYARWYGLQYALVYLSNVYGPRERPAQEHGTLIETWRQNYLKGHTLKIRGSGAQVRHFTHVCDAVAGVMLAAEKGSGDGYVIASKDRYSVLEISEMFGGKIEHVPVSPANRMDTPLDTSKIRQLGWRQVHTIEDYIGAIKRKGLRSTAVPQDGRESWTQMLDDVPTIDALEFEESADLGRDLSAFLIIKGFHQIEQNERYKRRLAEGGPLGRIDVRKYRKGSISLISLDTDAITDEHLPGAGIHFSGLEPHWIDFLGDWLIVTFCDEVVLHNSRSGEVRRLNNPWFGQIHSAVASSDLRRILVTSTGFDSIVECEFQTGHIIWRWSAWEHGFNLTSEGQHIRLAGGEEGQASPRVAVNGRLATLSSGGRQFGLPMRLQTCHINHARYAADDILAVFFHQGAVFRIDRRTGSHMKCLGGLKCPHGLFPTKDAEYLLSDTQVGRILFLDGELRPRRALSISNMPNVVPARRKATEWLQCTDLDEKGLLCAVDVHRSQIHLFDMASRRRRSIGVPGHWAMQRVVPVPATRGPAELGTPSPSPFRT
jgi:UDP-glucose 4-epimerase